MTPEFLPERTRYVHVGKRALWLLAIVLSLALIITAWVKSTDSSSRIIFAGGEKLEGTPAVDNDMPAMLKPHYQGTDSKNQPFSIRADKAIQKSKEQVLLQNLRADLMSGGKPLVITSVYGAYATADELLQLYGGVTLNWQGYLFVTPRTDVQTKVSSAIGNEPIQGTGPNNFALTADTFEIPGGNQGKIFFRKNVRVILYL